eukprot:gene37232-45195_t
MTSALPFPGGNYGFVRVALGPLCGYTVGCFEMMQNLLFVLSCVVKFSSVIADEFALPDYADIAVWAIVLLMCCGLVTMGSNVRNGLGVAFAAYNVIIVFLYYLASMVHDDFAEHTEPIVANRLARKSRHFLVASWFFMALNIVPFVASLSSTAKTGMSRSVLVFMVQLCVMALTICFVAVALGPDAEGVAMLQAPLGVGLQRLLDASPRAAALLGIAPMLAAIYVFLLALTRQMTSMANSGLLLSRFQGSLHGGRANAALAAFVFVLLLLLALLLRFLGIGWPDNLFNLTTM